MPEGPEIRRAADRIAKAIAQQPTEAVFFAFDHLKPYAENLTGRTVTDVKTYGKAMVICFDNQLCIYSHNQLYGQWMIRNAYDYPTTNRQLRLAIHNAKQSALLYSASEITVLHADEVPNHPFIRNLGLDVLDPAVTSNPLQAYIMGDRFRRRQFTALLLEQSFLGGIGNYLRSEILFVARIHPTDRPMDCSDLQIQQLAEAALAIPRQSYRHNGITNDLALAADLKAQGYPRSAYRYWVFGRDTLPCYVCGTPIIKAVSGGRRYYYCPTCQPKIR